MPHDRKPSPFWLVWNPAGFPPKYRHPTLRSAEDEKKRLAMSSPGQEFYVLAPVSKSVCVTLQTERYWGNDVPF